MDQDIQALSKMNEQELYKVIGLSSSGTQSIAEYKASYGQFRSFALESNPQQAADNLDKHLESTGKSLFQQIKDVFQEIICATYNIIAGRPGPKGTPIEIVTEIWNKIKDNIGFWVGIAVKAALFLISLIPGFDNYCPIPATGK